MRAEDVLDSLCPHDWLRVRAKHVFANSTERARHDDTQLSASQRLGVVPQAYLMAEETKNICLLYRERTTLSMLKLAILLCLRSFEGGFEYSAYQGCVSPAYTVLRPRFEINSSYWKNLFTISDIALPPCNPPAVQLLAVRTGSRTADSPDSTKTGSKRSGLIHGIAQTGSFIRSYN